MRIATVAIVGGDSLMAREVRDVFSKQAPDLGVKLTGLEGEGAVITEQGGEPAVITALEDQAEARLRAPLAEPPNQQTHARAVHVIAHPAASVLAAFFRRLHERHLAALLSECGEVPMPSIRLIQAPVFHGYSFSVWAEFDKNPGSAALLNFLACEQIEVRTEDEEPPTNVGAAGQSGITVGVVETDRRHPRCAWFWIVADNNRTSAENAVCLARLLIPGEGRA